MANRYWVGGTANWDGSATGKWATTSGGSPGAAVPTASDDVFFDAASGANTVTVTALGACLSLNFTGFTGTFAGSSALQISGSLTMGSGMTRTYTGNITFLGTGSKNLTFNGIVMASLTNFQANGTWTLQDNWDNGGTNINFVNGDFNANGKTITCGSFQTGAGTSTRVLTFGAATINCTIFDMSVGSNITVSAASATINVRATGGAFRGIGASYGTVNFVPTGVPALVMTGANTFGALSITGTAQKAGQITFADNITVTGAFTVTGNSAVNRFLIASDTIGTPRTITVNGSLAFQRVDVRDITGAGSVTWNLAAITGLSGDCGGNTNITFTTAATQTWSADTGNWSNAAKWTSRVPLPQDDVVFGASSFTTGSQAITADMPRSGKNINWTGVTNTPVYNIGNVPKEIYGSLTLVSGMTIGAGTGAITLAGRGTFTITSAGLSFNSGFVVEAPGGSYTLQDALSSTATSVLVVNHGTFDANDKAVTMGLFNSTGTGTRRVDMGNGTWTLTGVGNVWNTTTTTNLTFNCESSTIKVNDASASAKAFLGGGLTFNNFLFTGAGSGTLTVDGSNTFNDFGADTPPHSILFTAGTTQTVTTWSIEGTAGNLMTINSTTTTNFVLSKASGVVITNYMSIANSDAGGGATWYAGANSTDAGGGNTGWIFTNAVLSKTKSLKYTVVAPLVPSKSLKYCIKAPVAPTKSLKYAVVVPVPITKSLTYRVVVPISTLMESLKYAVKSPFSIPLATIYKVKAPVAVTKSLKYTVGLDEEFTKQLQYTVKVPHSISLSERYTVKTTPSALTKSLTYFIPTIQLKTLRYAVKRPVAITKSLTYRIKPYPYRSGATPYSNGANPYSKSATPYIALRP